MTYDQLKDLFILDYEINKKKSLDRAMRSVRWLREFFDGYKAIDITTKEIQKYIKGFEEYYEKEKHKDKGAN